MRFNMVEDVPWALKSQAKSRIFIAHLIIGFQRPLPDVPARRRPRQPVVRGPLSLLNIGIQLIVLCRARLCHLLVCDLLLSLLASLQCPLLFCSRYGIERGIVWRFLTLD